jgi:predicted S18 family serine protease
MIYYFSNYNGEDYLKIITEAKKKATEQEYSLAMVLLMDMTTTWTTMTKKEAEEYRHELELAREAQSLRSSQG